MAKFADYFEDRYFPLPQYLRFGEAEEYAALVNSIPLIALGFGYQDYDDLIANGGDGYQLMTYFFRQPYDDQGARVAMGESCQAHVPAELLERLPEGGFFPEEIHKLLDGTPYSALALWGDMIHLSTGNDFLDIDEEMMGNSVPPEWARENVEYFTRAWAEAQAKQEITHAMAMQFDEKPQEFFQEIIDFMDKRKEARDGTNADQGTDTVSVGIA
jgi:hypothetical protein